jgi:hypothetical protein
MIPSVITEDFEALVKLNRNPKVKETRRKTRI